MLFADGSILAVALNQSNEESRYDTLIRLTEGPSTWTGSIVFSTRALRELIDPAYLPDFDRLLRQALTIDDLVVLPDDTIWIAVRYVASTSVRGTWIVRVRPSPAWDRSEFDVIATLPPGSRADAQLPIQLDWVPELGAIVVDRKWFLDPFSPERRLLPLFGTVPSNWIASHDGAMWMSSPESGYYAFSRLVRLRLVPEVADLDGDTRTAREESSVGASDVRLDSDHDGILDVLEVGVFSTDPGNAASRPDIPEVTSVPRFGLTTRVHSFPIEGANLQWTYESRWSSSPFLCVGSRCVDGTGMAVAHSPTSDIASFTADGLAWIGWSRRRPGITFSDGTLAESVSLLLALRGDLGLSERGWVRRRGIFPYDTTLRDRTRPHGIREPILLGIDEATGNAIVAVSDDYGQLVLRVADGAGSGNARALFRPSWYGLGNVISMSWLDRHGLYIAQIQRSPGAAIEHVFLDRAMRVVGTLPAPIRGKYYHFGRWFGEGYAVSGSGPEYARGNFFSFFLGEAVPDVPGLHPGDVLAWTLDGLWVYRENGAMVQLAGRERLRALADEAARPLLDSPMSGVQLNVRPDRAEACLVDERGHLFLIAFANGEPTAVTLAERDGVLGCAYDEEGRRYTLRTVGLRLVVRDAAGTEVAGGAPPTATAARMLFAARNRSGERVWIVDTIGSTPYEQATTLCLRAGEANTTGFNAAGLDVQGNTVAWIDAVLRSYRPTDATVRAATVDDFCAGRAGERAHPPGTTNIYHQIYEPLLGGDPMGGSPEITCDDAMLALRPDGRYLVAARRGYAPGLNAAPMAYLALQAGAWVADGRGTPIPAHDAWRRDQAGGITLASPDRIFRLLAVVPGPVPPGWGASVSFERPSRPSASVDAGVTWDAGMVRRDAGVTRREEPVSCLCSAPGVARKSDKLMMFLSLGFSVLLSAAVPRYRARGRG